MELHHVSAAVFTRGERKCFVLNPSFLSFYQLYITSVQGDVSLEVSEWSLLYKSVAQTSVEQFVLQKEEIVLFLGIPVSEVFLSNTEKFQDFYMSPVLPGVRIDAKNGRLFGTPEEVRDSTMVTIGGVSEGGVTREVTVRMSVRRCEDDREYTLVHVNVTGLSGTDRCEVILQGEAGVVLHESVEKQPEQELHSALCVPSGSYSLMFVPMLAGTVSYSYRISQNEPRSGLFDASSTFTTFTFTTQSLIPAASALWRYWIIDSPPPTDWYQSGTSESWRKSTASLIPEMEGTTGYYCTTFSASYSSQVSAFSVGAYVQGGIVMYLEWRLIVCICQKDHSIIILSLSKNQLLQKPLSFLDQSNSSHFLSIPVFKLLMVQKGIITVSVLKSTVFLQPHQLPSLYIWSTYKTDPIGFSKVNHGVQSRVLHLLGMNISKMPLMGTRLPSSLVRVIA